MMRDALAVLAELLVVGIIAAIAMVYISSYGSVIAHFVYGFSWHWGWQHFPDTLMIGFFWTLPILFGVVMVRK